MKLLLRSIITTALIFLMFNAASAQTDGFGFLDTVYADVARVDDQNWSITVSYSNDQRIVGISIPLKFDAGDIPVVADSAIYMGGRAERFTYKGFRADTADQCVTLGLIANMGPTNNTLLPGRGRIVTVFVSSIDAGASVENLKVDTTTTHPGNSLSMVADRVQPDLGADTIPIENYRIRQIRPVWIVRKSQ
ncbi:MAG: hypothetical protein JSV52_07770 [Candidatus Zixiibacteriota bacterium]|nr:MAG: hypothetical protein JSV52_07770 [candidate division Zixibacteria bacterium]